MGDLVLPAHAQRRGWDIVVAEAEERVAVLGEHGGVVVIDLDGLKTVNDTAGHQAGDALVRAAADRRPAGPCPALESATVGARA